MDLTSKIDIRFTISFDVDELTGLQQLIGETSKATREDLGMTMEAAERFSQLYLDIDTALQAL